MKKKIKAILLTLAMAAGLLVVFATPAQATIYWNCYSGVGCIWSGADGTASRKVVSVSNTGYNICHNMTSDWNDTASSASGDFGAGWTMALYSDANCGNSAPWKRTFHGHSESFTGLLAYFNDHVTSYAIIPDE